MSLYREHSSGYLRPRINPTAERIGGALILAACLSWLGPAFLDAEDDMVNLNAPAIEQGPLTAEELADWRRRYQQMAPRQDFIPAGDEFEEQHMQPAEAATDIGAEPAGRQRDGWLTGLWLRFVRWAG